MSWASISREAKKTSKKKIALVTPKQTGGQKMKIPSQYQGPGIRDQGPARCHTDQIRPELIQIRAIPWPKSGQGG